MLLYDSFTIVLRYSVKLAFNQFARDHKYNFRILSTLSKYNRDFHCGNAGYMFF